MRLSPMGCKVNASHDGRAHPVEHQYDPGFTAWYGRVEAGGTGVAHLVCADVLLEFADGRSGRARVLPSDHQEANGGGNGSGQALYFVGVSALTAAPAPGE